MRQRRQLFKEHKQVIDRFFEYRIQKENLWRKAFPEDRSMYTNEIFLEEFREGLWKTFYRKLIKENKDTATYSEMVIAIEGYEDAEVKSI